MGTSSTELFSPNYPDGFPDDDLMEWRFVVQPKHMSSVSFQAISPPRCLKKEAGVGYQRNGTGALILGLGDPQPARLPGSFSLTLRNCEVDLKHPGLSLHLLVSTSRGSLPVVCRVDLSTQQGLSIHIEKTLQADPDCELRMNSDLLQKATVLSGSSAVLSLLCCLPHHLLLTATKTTECSALKDCPAVLLTIPPVPSCLPTPLKRITWQLRPPKQATVELHPGGEGLTQLHPGDHQQCHGNATLTVAEGDGTLIGHFCPQGAVTKVQVHTNVTITASALEGRDLRLTSDPVINVRFSQRISERYIFSVSLSSQPLLLSSPGWPAGMKPNATVSWIVSVPPKMAAVVTFLNVSQPRCSRLHTNIQVQSLGSLEEMYSRREDERASSSVSVSSSFYLNMSNCHPDTGVFRAVTQITLREDQLLPTLLAVVGVVLVVMVSVVAVVCWLKRKRKRELSPQVSIYNANGISFLPGLHSNPKPQEDEEAHVYACIEDTAVYGPLLRDRSPGAGTDACRTLTRTRPSSPGWEEEEGPDVGTYRPFLAPPLPSRPASHLSSMMDDEVSA